MKSVFCRGFHVHGRFNDVVLLRLLRIFRNTLEVLLGNLENTTSERLMVRDLFSLNVLNRPYHAHAVQESSAVLSGNTKALQKVQNYLLEHI